MIQPTQEELTILVCVDRSEGGYCRIGGNVHPEGHYVPGREVHISFDRIRRLEDMGLMRRRHVSGWRNDDQWVPTDDGHLLAQTQ